MMFRHTLILALVGTLMLGVGCKEEAPPTSPPPTPPVTPSEVEDDAASDAEAQDQRAASVTGDEVMRETGEAVDTAVRFADQEKDKFVAASQEQLEALKAKWSSWQADAGEKTEQMKQQLNEQYAEASEKLGKLKDTSGEAWTEMKAGFLDAYKDLETATKDAAQKFGESESDAP